jgi:hypothetical protein
MQEPVAAQDRQQSMPSGVSSRHSLQNGSLHPWQMPTASQSLWLVHSVNRSLSSFSRGYSFQRLHDLHLLEFP